MPETFPVIWPFHRDHVKALEEVGCPRRIPWSVIASHEAQAQSNHGQTLARLAERGGLNPTEIIAVLTDKAWHEVVKMPYVKAAQEMMKLVEERSADG